MGLTGLPSENLLQLRYIASREGKGRRSKIAEAGRYDTQREAVTVPYVGGFSRSERLLIGGNVDFIGEVGSLRGSRILH